jgi:hypothetical protein
MGPLAMTLLCVGVLGQANNMAWDQRRIEFSLDYARNAQGTTLKSNITTLNAPLVVEWDDAFMKAKESLPRPIGNDDRSIAITDLKISRNTGTFTMVSTLYRNIDVLDGTSLWEGNCALKGATDKKF